MKKRGFAFLMSMSLLALASCSTAETPEIASGTPTENTGSQGEEAVETVQLDPIQIATKPMVEQFILGEMLGLLIEDVGYEVEITKGIAGGTSNIQPAMEAKEFDLYPEYTSSGWVLVLGNEAGSIDDSEMLEALQAGYSENYGMTWVGMYGFNNTYTIAVRQEIADQYGLVDTSDLQAVASELNFGSNPDYIERADGFPALCETYGLKFASVSDVDIGLKYQALSSGDIDVSTAFTTDAALANPDAPVAVLNDDLGLQVNYFCSTIVREEVLEEYPLLEDALLKMDGILSDKEMAELNFKVEQGEDELEVARTYLVDKGLLDG
ncbi:MAG: glycine betaine ABC transporter substrate-binding protein [Eubacteriales bacterium]